MCFFFVSSQAAWNMLKRNLSLMSAIYYNLTEESQRLKSWEKTPQLSGNSLESCKSMPTSAEQTFRVSVRILFTFFLTHFHSEENFEIMIFS